MPPCSYYDYRDILRLLHDIRLVLYTMVLHHPEELHSQDSIQGHEEQEEDGDIVDLLAGPPVDTH